MQLPLQPNEIGWIAVFAWIVWEVYAPKFFHVETRFHEIVTSLNTRIDAVGERIDDLEEQQSKIVAITEVIAIETDTIDGDNVQEVLRDEEVIAREDIVDDDVDNYYSVDEDVADD